MDPTIPQSTGHPITDLFAHLFHPQPMDPNSAMGRITAPLRHLFPGLFGDVPQASPAMPAPTPQQPAPQPFGFLHTMFPHAAAAAGQPPSQAGGGMTMPTNPSAGSQTFAPKLPFFGQ